MNARIRPTSRAARPRVNRIAPLILACAVGAIAGGCGSNEQATLVIGLATDLDAPAPLAQARIRVYRLDARGNPVSDQPVPDETFTLSGTPDVPSELPGSYVLVADDEARIKVVASGLDAAGREIVTRTATLQLLAGQTRFMRLGLVGACVDQRDCPQGRSCIEGVCQAVHVEVRALPSYAAGMESNLACSSGTAFRNTARKQMLVPGAGCTPDEYCLEGTCYKLLPDGTANGWQLEAARAVCAQQVRCGAMPDSRTCMADYLGTRSQWFANLEAALAAGRLTLDQAKANECFGLLRGYSCAVSTSPSDFRLNQQVCDRVFLGSVATGGTCIEDLECAAGFCQPASACDAALACCPGTCRPRGPAGATCDRDRQCTVDATCLGGTCQPPSALGGPCSSTANCLQGVCSVNGLCVAPSPEGQPCVDAADCDQWADAVCTAGRCATRARVGQPCQPTGGGTCVAHATCVAGTCQPLPLIGDACGNGTPCFVGECLPSSTPGRSRCQVPAPPPPCDPAPPDAGAPDGPPG